MAVRRKTLVIHSTLLLFTFLLAPGCYAPLHSPGVPARDLPEEFRIPFRSLAPTLNLSDLTARQPDDYILGFNDVLEVRVPDLYEGAVVTPLRVQIMANGEIHLPLTGAIKVGGMNLMDAQKAINDRYADGILANPRVNIYLAEKATVEVVVLGEVNAPGVYPLAKFQNDVGHAVAAAGGFSENAAKMVEVHRRLKPLRADQEILGDDLLNYQSNPADPKEIIQIPLRGLPAQQLTSEQVVLNHGDVVVVPNRKHEVFFVVGPLDPNNQSRLSIGSRELRELGNGLILPQDNDIDVVTAVAMAGYIDPVDSPTTVTVHRHLPDGKPLLIRVDLIAARYDPQESVLIEPGDIIYLNPDAQWYMRKHFDDAMPRIIADLIRIPYAEWLGRAIGGSNGNSSVVIGL